MLPAHTSVHCTQCPPVPGRDSEVKITASRETCRRLVELMRTAGTVVDIDERALVSGMVARKVSFTIHQEGGNRE